MRWFEWNERIAWFALENNAWMTDLSEQRHAACREGFQRHDLLPSFPHFLIIHRSPMHDFHLRRSRGRRVHQSARDPLQNHARRDQSRQQLVEFASDLEQRRRVLLCDDDSHDGLEKSLPIHQHDVLPLQSSPSVRRSVRFQQQQRAAQVPIRSLHHTHAPRRLGRCAATAKKAPRDPRSDSFAAECLEPSRNKESVEPTSERVGAEIRRQRQRLRIGAMMRLLFSQQRIRRQLLEYFSMVRRRPAWAFRDKLSASLRRTTRKGFTRSRENLWRDASHLHRVVYIEQFPLWFLEQPHSHISQHRLGSVRCDSYSLSLQSQSIFAMESTLKYVKMLFYFELPFLHS